MHTIRLLSRTMTTPDPVTAVPTEPAAVPTVYVAPPAGQVIDAEPAPLDLDGPVIVVQTNPEPEPVTEAAPAADEPEPADDETPAPLDPLAKDWVHPEGWKYDWIPFRGDRLAIKIPTKGMVAALKGLGGAGPYFQVDFYNNYKRLHISEESFARVISRTAFEDGYVLDDDGIEPPIDHLAQQVLKLGVERDEKDREELAAVRAASKTD